MVGCMTDPLASLPHVHRYLKLGQFIASSPTLFPPELVLEMQKCLDQTEPVPYGACLVDRSIGRLM